MVSTAEGTTRERNELEEMLHDAAGRLSPAHVAALVAHPEAVRSALAAADALTAGDGERRSEVETTAGHVLPTRGYDPERLRAGLRAVRIERGPPDAPSGQSPRHVPGLEADDLYFRAMMDRALAEASSWDEPELDEIILSAIAPSRQRVEEGD